MISNVIKWHFRGQVCHCTVITETARITAVEAQKMVGNETAWVERREEIRPSYPWQRSILFNYGDEHGRL